MRTLRWMSGNMLKVRIINECISGKLEVVLIEHKMRENRLRWSRRMQCTPIHAPIRRSNKILVKGATRSWGNLKQTWLRL